MLLQDLQDYGKKGRAVDEAIQNKLRIEMIYYLVLEETLARYGTVDTNQMNEMNPDALGAARDQMAMMASDQGLVHYDENDRVISHADIKTLIKAAFQNSEAVRQTVLTHLASNDYKAEESIDDDKMFVYTDKEFEEILDFDKTTSLVNRVLAKINAMDYVVGEEREDDEIVTDLYATSMRAEQIITNGDRAGYKKYTDETISLLKISPLMPEIRHLRKLNEFDLGLTNEVRSESFQPEIYNSLLMYDTQKQLLSIAQSDMSTYHNKCNADEFKKGIVFGNTEYGANIVIHRIVTATIDDGYETADGSSGSTTKEVDVATSMNQRMNIVKGMQIGFKWRMMHIMEKYSQRALTAEDIDVINDMFEFKGSKTMFGDLNKDSYEQIMQNANAYFDYIDYVCEKTRDNMSSHEFEIHLRHVDYLEKARGNRDKGTAIMMYMTGERTDDYNRARSNSSRYFAFYPYTNYTPVNLDVNPVIGDIAPASYNDYLIVDRTMHVGDAINPEVSNVFTNPYAHADVIDVNMVRRMRSVFDAYQTDNMHDINHNIEIRKSSRRLGETDVKDLSKFINENGTIKSGEIIKYLIDDLNTIKEDQRMNFLKPESTEHFQNILDRFKEYQGVYEDDEDPTDKTMSMVVQDYIGKHNDIKSLNQLQKSMKQTLNKYMIHELRDAYGSDIDSFIVSKHIYSKYINDYVDACVSEIAKVNGVENYNRYIRNMNFDIDHMNLEQISRQTVVKMQTYKDPLFEECMDEIFGKGELQEDGVTDSSVRQNILLKPNMCKHVSKTFRYDMYEDMLRLLSYTNVAEFEQNMSCSEKAIFEKMGENRTDIVLQLYSVDVYLSDTVETDVSDDVENIMDEEEQTYNAAFDDVMWYTSTFAKVQNEDDISYAWLSSYDTASEEERIIFKATHPLQYEAMQKTHQALIAIEGRNYDRTHLNITKNGIIYYMNDDDSIAFKIGPVIDEKAYIRPLIQEDENGDVEITRVKRDRRGNPLYDEHGKTLDETVRVNIIKDIVIENGVLQNEIVFGALDTPALTGDSNTVANRFYGISAKVNDYDGYDHTDEQFTDRLKFHTYKTSVLNTLDKNLILYAISKNKTVTNQTPESIFYTNVCASSLQKCYRTNTYIIEEKTKCKMADHFMSQYLTGDPYSVLGENVDDETARRALEKMSSLVMMQAKMYHNRVVMPKIEVSQNIGLYNQLLNLHQCSYDEVYDRGMTEAIDRKEMRNSDLKNMRVSYSTPSIMFDNVLSGTAKQLGAVAFFTDAVKFNDLTGDVVIAEDAAEHARCTLTSTGIIDFATDDINCRLVNYPGGQAVDRMQLSANAIEKALNYQSNVCFAMINLGYNMEDGYVVAKRAAHKFGHFSHDNSFNDLVQWDKIGDTESGNKGVTAKIVDTDIGAGMSEEDAERAFMIKFAKEFIPLHMFNHGNVSDKILSKDFKVALDKAANQMFNTIQGNTWEDKLKHLPVNGSDTLEKTRDMITLLRSDDDASIRKIYDLYQADIDTRDSELVKQRAINEQRAKELEQKINDKLDEYYSKIGQYLHISKVEPFYGKFEIEHKLWQVFRDNSELDLAVTNVCVLTRSNPSLLMYICDALEIDHKNGITKDNIDVNNPQGESVIILRDENGQKYADMGACGRYNIYVDSHTSEDKQRDYTEASAKNGRGYGSQEVYALTAKHANNAFVKFITYNDPTLPDRISKLNRRMIMNGFILDPNPNEKGDVFAVSTLSSLMSKVESESVIRLSQNEDATTYRTDMLPGHSFIDMDELANYIVDKIPANTSQDKYRAAVEDMVRDLDYTRMVSLYAKVSDEKEMSSTAIEEMMRHMFVTSFGKYGGNFMVLPESLESSNIAVYHNFVSDKDDNGDANFITDSNNMTYSNDLDYDLFSDMSINYDDQDAPVGDMYMLSHNIRVQNENGEIINRKVAPLYLSSREILNSDSETVTSNVDDKLQFKIFKTVIAAAVVDKLYERENIDEETYNKALAGWSNNEKNEHVTGLKNRITKLYADVTNPSNKSLELKDMSRWLKKNIYRNIFPNSLTCVWSGNPTLEIDEAGLSFEKAKSLGLLRIKRDENGNEIDVSKIPDDYAHMADRYEPISDDDFVLINRSPGQTTGCIRAFRLVITGPDGDGLQVHPACATIFDGDFDGDTIGVINPKVNMDPHMSKEEQAHFDQLALDAYRELGRTMSLHANMVHTADYSDIDYVNEDGENITIKYVHPLFIAGNADIAIAKHSMMKPDENGKPACGYDVSKELERIQVMANLIEQMKQCRYDRINYLEGSISKDAYMNIVDMRTVNCRIQIGVNQKGEPAYSENEVTSTLSTLYNYFDSDKTIRKNAADKNNRDWYDMKVMFSELNACISTNDKGMRFNEIIVSDQVADIIEELEKTNKERLTKVYRDMTGYISKNPLYTHGESQVEMLSNIIRDANISKKGKAPQLNALLVFSGTHAKCGGDLIVVESKENGKKAYELRQVTDEHPEGIKIDLTKEEQQYLKDTVKLSHKNAQSDVPISKHRTQIESNIAAQSCKSDATGLGGSMAQKMQKLFAIYGYGELGLRISGPITQVFLDAKQNVTKCEKNLKIGKYVLDKICKFEYVHELSDEYMSTACKEQVYNGQYTFKTNEKNQKGKIKRVTKHMTVDECVSQLNNFLVVMGQPELSKIDKAIVSSVLSNYTERDKTTGKMVVKKPIQKADKQGDMSYASMYDSKKHYLTILKHMADKQCTLWSGSAFYDHKIDTSRIVREHMADNQPKEMRKQLQSNISNFIEGYRQKVKDVQVETRNKTISQNETENRGMSIEEANAYMKEKNAIGLPRLKDPVGFTRRRLPLIKERVRDLEDSKTQALQTSNTEVVNKKGPKVDVRDIKQNEDNITDDITDDITPVD